MFFIRMDGKERPMKKKLSGFGQIWEQVHAFERKIAYAIDGAEREIRETVQTVKERDPAARSAAEVLILYSGVHAIMAHRVSHKLYENGHYFSARAISQLARHCTGIEIHPAAKIGRRFFIDHGTGVVIGETAIIGDDVVVYQGVTLGGTGKDTGKRHPTIGNNVIIGSGAKVLGPFKVGDNSKIAAGAVVLNEIPPNSTAVGIPARVVRVNGERNLHDLDHIHIPDPISQKICELEYKIQTLEKKLAEKTDEK
jgi:serine O-acetyltransferase